MVFFICRMVGYAGSIAPDYSSEVGIATAIFVASHCTWIGDVTGAWGLIRIGCGERLTPVRTQPAAPSQHQRSKTLSKSYCKDRGGAGGIRTIWPLPCQEIADFRLSKRNFDSNTRAPRFLKALTTWLGRMTGSRKFISAPSQFRFSRLSSRHLPAPE
jgi:hypothetical protein